MLALCLMLSATYYAQNYVHNRLVPIDGSFNLLSGPYSCCLAYVYPPNMMEDDRHWFVTLDL